MGFTQMLVLGGFLAYSLCVEAWERHTGRKDTRCSFEDLFAVSENPLDILIYMTGNRVYGKSRDKVMDRDDIFVSEFIVVGSVQPAMLEEWENQSVDGRQFFRLHEAADHWVLLFSRYLHFYLLPSLSMI